MDEFADHLQRRIRNLHKRKQRLQRYEQLVANPNKLNADQRATLAKKESVYAPLRELEELQQVYQWLAPAAAAKSQSGSSVEPSPKAAPEPTARTEAAAAPDRTLEAVLQFLHVAAIRC